jgi:hypothetical protein
MTHSIPGLQAGTPTIDGHETVCDVGGAGRPSLLLHGFRLTRLTWRAVAPPLSERFVAV